MNSRLGQSCKDEAKAWKTKSVRQVQGKPDTKGKVRRAAADVPPDTTERETTEGPQAPAKSGILNVLTGMDPGGMTDGPRETVKSRILNALTGMDPAGMTDGPQGPVKSGTSDVLRVPHPAGMTGGPQPPVRSGISGTLREMRPGVRNAGDTRPLNTKSSPGRSRACPAAAAP